MVPDIRPRFASCISTAWLHLIAKCNICDPAETLVPARSRRSVMLACQHGTSIEEAVRIPWMCYLSKPWLSSRGKFRGNSPSSRGLVGMNLWTWQVHEGDLVHTSFPHSAGLTPYSVSSVSSGSTGSAGSTGSSMSNTGKRDRQTMTFAKPGLDALS